MNISSKVLMVAALAGLVGLTACDTQQRTRTTRPSTSTNIPAGVDETVMDPDASGRTVSRGGWPTMRSGGGMSWGNMAYPTGNAGTSAIGIEIGTPMEVRANQPFDASVVVTNLTDQTLQDVTVTEQLGENYTLRSASLRGRQNADGTVSWTIDELAPRESKTIRMTGVATGSGQITNCVSVAYASLLCATVNVVEPELQLVKSGPSEVLACDEIVYRFTVRNSGTGTIENVRITDPLPEGMTSVDGGRNITFDVGRLAAGQSRDLTARVRASRSGSFENRAQATGAGGLSVDSAPITTVVRKPTLTITKNCPQEGFIGRPLQYRITVNNTGNGEARNTVLEDIVPAGARVLNASDGGRTAGGKVTWNLGTLAPDGSKTVTLTVQADQAGTVVNRATAQAFCADMVSDSCSSEVKGIPAILLEVIDLDDPILVGNNVTYQIVVTNQGSAPAQNVTIRCMLEEAMEFVSAGGATPGRGQGLSVNFQPLASLAPGAKATWTVVVRAGAPGDVRFATAMTSRIITRPVEETEATRFYQ